MGSAGQLRFIEQHVHRFEGPFLETGSKDYGNTQDLRHLFSAKTTVNGRSKADLNYVGVDMFDGPGVDVVADLAGHFDEIDAALGGRRFGTIFCLSVLEHCENPFAMAENLVRLLRPGGKLCVSAPFAFKLHAYPDDFWRFTPAGIQKLFEPLQFRPEDSVWTTGLRNDDFRPVDSQLGKLHFSFSAHQKTGHPLRGLSAKTLSLLAKFGFLRWLAGYRYVLAPTDIIMIGSLPRFHAEKNHDATTN
ncbi:MAG: methyltransferase domain-containing protein [Planctomycetota bacterium]|nr:methyltransferase domain-containing protein [Planctomycetota bacterium]